MNAKERILLIAFGTLLGCGAAAGLCAVWYFTGYKATHFSSISDLHDTMVHREDDKPQGGDVSLRSIILPHSNREVIFTLQPNLAVQFQGVPVRINECGMRGGNRSRPREPGTLRIALLGDSFAFGWGVKEDETFAVVLERALASQLSAQYDKVEVLNLGVPGYSTFQEVAAYEETGQHWSPDAVLVYFVENDFGLPFFLGESSSGLMTAIDFAKSVWESKSPEAQEERRFLEDRLDPNKALKRLARLTRKQGIPVFVAVNPGRSTAKATRRLSVLRQNVGVGEISLYDAMEQEIVRRGIVRKELSLPTDPHPSAIKHKLLGELLAKGLIEKGVQGVPAVEND